jgi:hypothetical protein
VVDAYLRLQSTFVAISERYADSTEEANEKVSAFKGILSGTSP